MLKSKIQNPKSSRHSGIPPNVKCLAGKRQMSKQRCWNFSFVICALSFVILTMGCAAINEGVKGIAGVSTKVLEKGRKTAITKTFNYDYFTCYTKTVDILKQLGAYAYAKDVKKKMIAFYISEEDTTPVGLFFKEIDSKNIQVEVSSPSSYAKEFFAEKIFSALGNPKK
jgi:hypothetical protein